MNVPQPGRSPELWPGISKIKNEEGEAKRGDTMKERLKAGYEITTGALALFAVSLAVLDMTRGLNQWQRIADNIVLAVFIIDYIVRLFASGNKREFVKHNIFDLIAIIPFSSFFRAFRIARLARLMKIAKISKFFKLAAYSLRLVNRAKIFFDTNGFKYVLALSCVLVAVGGVLIHFAEGMDLSDGLWWAFVTTTTVGYGDISPSTGAGRAIAIVLMITGIGLLGTLTSTITSFFLNLKAEKPTHRDEVLSLVLSQLEDLDNLSNEDIDRICEILQTFKKE